MLVIIDRAVCRDKLIGQAGKRDRAQEPRDQQGAFGSQGAALN